MKKWISMALTLLMVLALLPAVYAADDGAAAELSFPSSFAAAQPTASDDVQAALQAAPAKAKVLASDGAQRKTYSGKLYRVNDTFNVTIPDGLEIFTRDDQKHEMSNGVIGNASPVFINKSELYLYATNTKNTVWYEFTVEDSQFEDFNNLDFSSDSADYLIWKDIEEKVLQDNGYEMTDFAVYSHVDTTFLKETCHGNGQYFITYFTVYDGKYVQISLGTDTNDLRESKASTLKKIVNSADFVMPFLDVSWSAFYANPVIWAVNHDPQITAGTNKEGTIFSPNMACTRSQMVTFLWRAAGCPDPETTRNPFEDVKSSAYYYKAVLWAVENGITAGTNKAGTVFSPNMTVDRSQTVTFLWRLAGKPTVEANNPFQDVGAKAYYYHAVLWAVKENITAGTNKAGTQFSPLMACSRSQIVTFLYRYMGD